MYGPNIYVRTLSQPRSFKNHDTLWQYHSRSDSHSKASCWAVLFDLLLNCRLLAEHAQKGKIGFGINHEMNDFRMNRKKKLDLVICAPGGDFSGFSFARLGSQYLVELDGEEKKLLGDMPEILQCPVGTTLIALEAKACMTEHIKACPRLYDELTSSFQTINGDTNNAIAAGLITINTSREFISPLKNADSSNAKEPKVTLHKQPHATKRVLNKISELRRRSHPGESGFDALGVVLIDFRNDGSRVNLVEALPNGTQVQSILTYEKLIERIGLLYSSRFSAL